MKTLTLILTTAVLAFATSSVDAQQRQQSRTKTAQQRTQQQRLVVQPQPGRPAPRLGVTGQFQYGWGFKVQSVVPGSPAAQMGLEAGDVIKNLNNFRITSTRSIGDALRHARDYYGGDLHLTVDNVRARNGWDPYAQRIVSVRGSLYYNHYNQPPFQVQQRVNRRVPQTGVQVRPPVKKTQTRTRTSNRNRNR